MGRYNSSATRILPFFKSLVDRDPEGETWLPSLLTLFKPTDAVPGELLEDPGRIQHIVFATDTRLEHSIAPPRAFLEWLIKNPERMIWPKGKAGIFSPKTTRLRSDLFGLNPTDTLARKAQAQKTALCELEVAGSTKSKGKWWAFEGSTKVDCYIRTDRMKIYVEGKRTELLSPATAWYPERNQLVRNTEAGREDAAGMPFVSLVLREKPIRMSQNIISAGLPHLSAGDADSLMQHYLGDASWKSACEATGIDYCKLPEMCA